MSSSGIFTNYTYTENHVVDTLEYLDELKSKQTSQTKTIATAGGGPPLEPASVYFSTDVHGRGTYAGGGHDSHKAVEFTMSLGFSHAIFAPGWLMENFNHAELGRT